jgi:phenylacetate-CoA ligase
MLTRYYERFESQITPHIAYATNNSPAFADRLRAAGLAPEDFHTVADLAKLPVFRKDDLIALQKQTPPLGGLLMTDLSQLRRLYQSPGPIYEPEPNIPDYWRWRPALQALGAGKGDLVLNCFGYHLTPAGAMFEEGVRALGATVIPGGIGNQEAQATLLATLPVTVYIGLPSYLKALLEKVEALGFDPRQLALRRALVTAEPLPPSLRTWISGYGIAVLQCYGTAEAGNLGWEIAADQGLHVPADALVQVCDLNTGEPLPPGVTGEVVVTLFNPDYALIRFGVGDLSAWHVDPFVPGVETPRLVGWQGRIGDAVKVRGMFLHPKQAAGVLARFPSVTRYQFVITREDHKDYLTCRMVVTPGQPSPIESVVGAIRDGLKFQCQVETVDSLPEGAPPILDQRDWSA